MQKKPFVLSLSKHERLFLRSPIGCGHKIRSPFDKLRANGFCSPVTAVFRIKLPDYKADSTGAENHKACRGSGF
jgi:hypothetical protein